MKKRPDGRYQKYITVNGKRIYFYSTADTEKKAIKDIENQMLAYTQKEKKGKTFGEVADEWENMHYPTLQHQTAVRYAHFVNHLYKGIGNSIAFKNVYIKDIKSKDFENFFSEMARLGYSTKTIKDQMSVAKMIFRYACIKEYITTNVLEYLRPLKGTPKKQRESLTDEEIKIVEQNTDKEFGLLAYFMLYTGLRKSEVLALTYGDIDQESKVINVNKAIEFVVNTPRVKSTKTEAGTRKVPLLDNVSSKLGKGNKNDIIFSYEGDYITRAYFEKHWKKYCKEIGIDITSHQLRHTFTTLLYEWGIDDKDSQELLGHSDISTTRNIYTHIRQSRIQATTEKLNKIINSVSNSSQNS